MIYIDMDGVIADFDQAIIDVFGEQYSNKLADKFWKCTCVDGEVFRRMPPIEEGIRMVDTIHNNNIPICFMTSTGGLPHHIDIAKQKLDWLQSHGFGMHPVAFCMNTAGKGAFSYPGAILIDDRQKVCDAWKINGGIAILFTPGNSHNIAAQIIGQHND